MILKLYKNNIQNIYKIIEIYNLSLFILYKLFLVLILNISTNFLFTLYSKFITKDKS